MIDKILVYLFDHTNQAILAAVIAALIPIAWALINKILGFFEKMKESCKWIVVGKDDRFELLPMIIILGTFITSIIESILSLVVVGIIKYFTLPELKEFIFKSYFALFTAGYTLFNIFIMEKIKPLKKQIDMYSRKQKIYLYMPVIITAFYIYQYMTMSGLLKTIFYYLCLLLLEYFCLVDIYICKSKYTIYMFSSVKYTLKDNSTRICEDVSTLRVCRDTISFNKNSQMRISISEIRSMDCYGEQLKVKK